MATFNRADTLRRALDSIAKLTDSDGLFRIEAVVIDNGSTDHTKQVVDSVAENCRFPIRYFFESQPGLPFARNRAVRESRGEWIAFFDDDQLTDSGWLSSLYSTACAEQVSYVGGSRSLLIEAEQQPAMTAYCRELLGEVTDSVRSDYHVQNLPCTGNVLIHRSLFETYGLFDEKVLDGGEDSDFFNRIAHAGIRGVYDPDAVVQHIIPQRRLERDYLELIAYRHGRHVCRRDLLHRGRLVTYFSAAARILWVGISSRLKMSLAFLAARQGEIVSQSCKWRRACGYLSFALRNPATRPDSAARTMHRGT